MADVITYREAVAEGIAREMRIDPTVVCLGEDIGEPEGVFKTTVGLYKEFGAQRVWDTPISEQAILGAAMGAAMTGIPVIAEIMFSDFIAVCFDLLANEIAKSRYMTAGQVSIPIVVRTANGGGSRFGAQHSQSVENWVMMIPGLKVVAPSTPLDVVGLMAASVSDPDPVVFLEHKSLMADKQDVPDGEIVDELGVAKVVREGTDCTIAALALMVPRALEAAERLEDQGISAEVIDVRFLNPLNYGPLVESVKKTGKVVIASDATERGSFAHTIASNLTQLGFDYLDGPPAVVGSRNWITPAAELEDMFFPTKEWILDTIHERILPLPGHVVSTCQGTGEILTRNRLGV